MLPGDDMVNLMGNDVLNLSDPAIFEAVVGAMPNDLPNRTSNQVDSVALRYRRAFNLRIEIMSDASTIA